MRVLEVYSAQNFQIVGGGGDIYVYDFQILIEKPLKKKAHFSCRI